MIQSSCANTVLAPNRRNIVVHVELRDLDRFRYYSNLKNQIYDEFERHALKSRVKVMHSRYKDDYARGDNSVVLRVNMKELKNPREKHYELKSNYVVLNHERKEIRKGEVLVESNYIIEFNKNLASILARQTIAAASDYYKWN